MIKIVKKVGETVEESRLVDGALIDQRSMGRGGPTRVEKAQIGLIQFQLSPPKTDVCFLPRTLKWFITFVPYCLLCKFADILFCILLVLLSMIFHHFRWKIR